MDYDILVVGAGHAGCEAAHICAKMGLKTCLITIHLETIAQMSCNPAIGGLAKGQLVREIDALGGLMGLLADETGIQFRLLNRSRGGAVQAPRAQSDKAQYRIMMKNWLENVTNLDLFQDIVTELLVKNNKIYGVKTIEGNRIKARAVILTPGTFLNGLIHIGLHNYQAGRANEPASRELSESLEKNKIALIRLKTGTPMRIHKDTIDWAHFQPQPGDENPVPFSFRTHKRLSNKIICYIGHTNQETHSIIQKNLKYSPLFSGNITGIGPRYCPSIEDKVVKFPHRQRHQFYLEPEGLNTAEVYVNGLSSSLPLEVQKKFIRSIPGLEHSRFLRPAYGIEYDAAAPTQLLPTLELKTIENLYLAGQINGTSGYEEAAAQGIIAGINAALKIKMEKPFIIRRDEAYIGVLIDDLVSKGIEEPYRLFTSRAEYRLNLRMDNADQRLMPHGYRMGLIDKTVYDEYIKKLKKIERTIHILETVKMKYGEKDKISLKSLLKKPEVKFKNMLEYTKFEDDLNEEEIRYIESEIKYEGYIQKQQKEIARILKIDREKIPAWIDFNTVPGFSREVVEKLKKFNPKTIEEAKKIPGITPAAIMNLHVYIQIKKKERKKS